MGTTKMITYMDIDIRGKHPYEFQYHFNNGVAEEVNDLHVKQLEDGKRVQKAEEQDEG